MNKLQNILLLIGVMLLTYSCYKDRGNYDYTEWEKITIKNVEDLYTKSYMKEHLVIAPDVSSNIPGDFLYSWTYGDLLDTIATGPVLDTLVTWLPNKNHIFYLHAKNKNTGYSVQKRFQLIANTPFLNAWYVLKDDGENSDVDMYETGNFNKIKNVLRLVNGSDKMLKGKGEKFVYSEFYIFKEELNIIEKTKTLFVLSERDIVGLDAALLKILWGYNNMFNIQAQEVAGPSFFGSGIYSHILVNSGQVYTITNQSKSNGKWGVKKEIDLVGTPYNVSKYVFDDYFYNQLVFDDLGSSFYTAASSNAQLRTVLDDTGTEMPANKNGKKMLYMGVNKPYMVGYGYAVMQDKVNQNLKMITRVKYAGSKVALRNDTLKAGIDKAYDGQFFTMARPEQGLYFVANNALYFRNVSSKRGLESLEFQIPDGEKATFVSCIDKNAYVVLGTQVGSGYKVRFFNKTTAGHINPVPDLILPREGEIAEGTARDVVFLSSSMSAMQVYSY